MKPFLLRVAIVALALAGVTGVAQAGWVTSGTASFSGNAPGKVEYAVYQNAGSTTLLSELNTALGLTGKDAYTASNNPLGATATTAATGYLYFYEVVNTGTDMLNTLTLGTDTSKVSAAGTVSSNAKNNVFNNPNTPTFTTSSAATVWAYDGAASSTQIDFGANGSNLGAGKSTSLMILASNGKPGEEPGLLIAPSGGSPATGSLPVPTPEPGTLALMGLAIPLLGWGYFRRLQAAKAAAETVAE